MNVTVFMKVYLPLAALNAVVTQQSKAILIFIILLVCKNPTLFQTQNRIKIVYCIPNYLYDCFKNQEQNSNDSDGRLNFLLTRAFGH